MKLLICLVISVIFCLHASIVIFSHAGEPVDTATRYLQALTEGNTEKISTYLGGKLYSKRKVLLEENASYPEFLRSHYQGVTFTISAPKTINPPTADKGVDVEFQFSNGDRMWVRLIMVKNSLGKWKVVDETDVTQ